MTDKGRKDDELLRHGLGRVKSEERWEKEDWDVDVDDSEEMSAEWVVGIAVVVVIDGKLQTCNLRRGQSRRRAPRGQANFTCALDNRPVEVQTSRQQKRVEITVPASYVFTSIHTYTPSKTLTFQQLYKPLPNPHRIPLK